MTILLKKGSRGEAVKQLQRALNLIPDGVFGELTEEAVKALQKSNNLKQDGIVGNKTWELLPKPDNGVLKQSKRNIKEIIVHCTATPEGRVETVESIRRIHKSQGWSDIGYHYLIYLDGSIHVGRDVNIVGSHCVGHNTYSIGVCYVGGVDAKLKTKDTRTPAQKESLIKVLKKLKGLYPKAKIHGHRDFSSKDCPSFDCKKEYKDL